MTIVYGYLLLLLFLGILDGIWLGFIARPFYVKHLGSMMRDMIHWPAALLFYFSYAAGVLYFSVLPAMEKSSSLHAALTGAFLGFIAYMAYDFTNWATLKDFPFIVVAADILWGIVVTAASSFLAVTVMLRYVKI